MNAPVTRRPRLRSLRSGAFFFLAAALTAAGQPLQGQDPLPADTTPADTTAAQDTVPPPPPPRLPDLRPAGPAGWEAGVWEWTRRDLLMIGDISLLDLLERIPGVAPVRAGFVGQPEGAAIFGIAGGGIRYVLDGFALDPLTTPTFDPSRLPLLALALVRVERRVTGAVVTLETLSPSDPRTHSVVEAATGDLDVNLFRGIFLAPNILGGPLAAGFERVAARSIRGSNLTGGWIKWTFVRDSAGVQLEYRQSEMDRSGVEEGFLGDRRDWAIRARARLLGLTTEGYAGATTVEDRDGTLTLREGTPQAGVRLGYDLSGWPASGVRLALRLRDHPRLPSTEAAVELHAAPLPWIRLGLETVQGWWKDGDPTRQHVGRLRVGPLLGVSLFSELSRGGAGVARIHAPVDSVVFEPAPAGDRLGASFDRWGIHLGAAALRVEADSVSGFGLPFDVGAPRFAGGEVTGIEAIASLPTGWHPLRLEGWYVRMDRPSTWLYLPDDHWRAGLVYRHSPLPSGNLDIHARIEHVFRGRMTTPCTTLIGCDDDDPEDGLVSVGSYRATNLALTIRVVTVRAFVRWENAFNRRLQQDLPFAYPAPPGAQGRFSLPGQHIVYGVKWEFWN